MEAESIAAESDADSVSAVINRRDVPFRDTPCLPCRRLPRITSSASRSVIPFIGRIALSDTYRIWKRGSNPHADMTLAGFDGFRIQQSDQTFMFLGDGFCSEDGKVSLPPVPLIVLSHKEKEITNALEGAGAQPSESEVSHEVALMSQMNMY
ncbi:hypothetical protein LXL04_015975 [Taraxacum kok-saghyz]